MITVAQLLQMPAGEKTGGGFLLTVKMTKKWVQLPNKRFIHTVVLFDNTGEILADFKDPSVAGYNPLIKGQQVHIVVAEIQQAEAGKGIKLFVDQYEVVREYGDPGYYQDRDDENWNKLREEEIKSKIRCWLVSSSIQGKELSKKEILKWQEFVLKGS